MISSANQPHILKLSVLRQVTIILYYFNLGKIKCNLGEKSKPYPKQIQRNLPFDTSLAKTVLQEPVICFERFARVS